MSPCSSPSPTAEQLAGVWKTKMQNGYLHLIAKQRDEILGMATFSLKGGFGGGAYLELMIVHQNARNLGIGAQLLQRYEEYTSESRGGWFALTEVTNTGGQRFYKRYGYTVVGTLDGFAGPGRSDLVLFKARK